MLTEEELQERNIKRTGTSKYWLKCDKCGEKNVEYQMCKCPTCSSYDKHRLFIHLNEPNPNTINWKSYDQELKVYTEHGCYDTWSLCNVCAKRCQMYADWTKTHPDLISYIL